MKIRDIKKNISKGERKAKRDLKKAAWLRKRIKWKGFKIWEYKKQ